MSAAAASQVVVQSGGWRLEFVDYASLMLHPAWLPLLQNPPPTPDFYVSCRLDDLSLNIRKEPNLLPVASDGSDNVITTVPGSTPLYRSGPDIDPPYVDQRQYRYIFVPIQYNGGTAYAAKLKMQPDPSPGIVQQFLYSTLQEAGCPYPPVPPTINPNDPNREQYYEAFKGLAFWVIYSETSEGSMIDQFDIVNDFVPASDVVPSKANAEQVLAGSGLSLEGYHRYLIARTVLDGAPEFDSDFMQHYGGINYETYTLDLFARGYKNALRWGSSIGTPTNKRFWGHEYCKTQLGDYNGIYSNAETTGYKVVLQWLTDYVECRKINDGENFQTVYDIIMPYVDLAIEHQFRNQINPVEGANTLRHANTCYVWNEDGTCRTNNAPELHQFCNERGCDPQVFNALGQETGEQVSEILPNTSVSQQVVYITLVGHTYSESRFGFYQYSPTKKRYFLIENRALGTPIYFDEDNPNIDALRTWFQIHWERLNRDLIPETAPSTFRPSFCMSGISHVLRIEKDPFTHEDSKQRTWQTFSYQNAGFPWPEARDTWFCH